MTRLRVAMTCMLLIGLLAVPAVPADAGGPSKSMVRKINRVRAKHGLRAVRHAPSLARSARSYASTMMARDFFGHSSHIHAPSRFNRLGEAIAMRYGRRTLASRTLRNWLHSPGHRALILSPGFRYVGAGVKKGRFRGHSATIWVLHLGSR